jgi:5'-nucleotidase
MNFTVCLIFLFADPFILQELNSWGKQLEAVSNEEIGRSKVFLDGDTLHCRLQECNLGNFLTDTYVDYVSTITLQYALTVS